jgi:hypothetical protein
VVVNQGGILSGAQINASVIVYRNDVLDVFAPQKNVLLAAKNQEEMLKTLSWV